MLHSEQRWTYALFLALCIVQGANAGVPEKAGPCTVPVRNGHPTEQDHGQSFRMISGFVMLPGIRRPVIYSWLRNGAWTIDDHDSFVPFPGEFPSNYIHDSFERDPNTGRIIGVGLKGVFVIEPGEVEFKILIRKGDFNLKSPGPANFIPRMSGFMLLDPSGLYLIDNDLRASQLRLDNMPDLINVGGIADLAELKAVLIGNNGRIYIRTDDGHSTLLATLEKWDFLTNAAVGPSGDTVLVQSYWNAFEIKISRGYDGKIIEPIASGAMRTRPKDKPFDIPPSSTRLQKEKLRNYVSSPIPVRGESILMASDGLHLIRKPRTQDQMSCN
ncbi:MULTISPECIES: hypothetical protein [Methylobacterium]|uniref:hypothetical protein n=1 Tax=Methylobacterium TaxID=407 RepID=UPI0013EA60C4|nr:hypothetical protein [Methylobacterium sp. DB0501]NGM38220.1 hypothetical protein [Methylobacterium sp. DB0501]